jgi:hypothetical protein
MTVIGRVEKDPGIEMVLSSARWLDPYETTPLVVNGVL